MLLSVCLSVCLCAKDGDEEYVQSLQEEQTLLQANLEYVGQMITDQQSEIVCMMESKGDGDTVEASSIIHNSSVREAKYLLEHFLDMAINFVSSSENIWTLSLHCVLYFIVVSLQ